MTTEKKSALVVTNTSIYASPHLYTTGKVADLGLLAEALIYYDNVIISIDSPAQLLSIFDWFSTANRFNQLIQMLRDGQIKFEYSDLHAGLFDAVQTNLLTLGVGRPLESANRDTASVFDEKILANAAIRERIGERRMRAFSQAVHQGLLTPPTTIAADIFNAASNDVRDKNVQSRFVQAFIDEVAPGTNIDIDVEIKDEQEELNIYYHTRALDTTANRVIEKWFGTESEFQKGSAINALAFANRSLTVASHLKSDLMLPNPLAPVASYKLAQAVAHTDHLQKDLRDLIVKVDFPDVRQLVNANTLRPETVFLMRTKADRFRGWLHSEAEIERDAVTAYHNEIAKESGFTKYGRKTLHWVGVLAGGAVGSSMGGPLAGVVGAVTPLIVDLAANMNANWKPVVFGDWAREVVKKDAEGSAR